MDRTKQWALGTALAALAAIGTAAIVAAATAEATAPPARSHLDRATEAALRHTGGGTILEAEAGDDGAAFGVEIRRPDGSVVEVALDASFAVIGEAADDDGPGDAAGD